MSTGLATVGDDSTYAALALVRRKSLSEQSVYVLWHLALGYGGRWYLRVMFILVLTSMISYSKCSKQSVEMGMSRNTKFHHKAHRENHQSN